MLKKVKKYLQTNWPPSETFRRHFIFLALLSRNRTHRNPADEGISVERMWYNSDVPWCLPFLLLLQLSHTALCQLAHNHEQNNCHLTFCHNVPSQHSLQDGTQVYASSGISQVPLTTFPCYATFIFPFVRFNIWSSLPPSDTALAEHYHHAGDPSQYNAYSKNDKTNRHKEQVVLVTQSWMAMSSQPKAQLREMLPP